MSSRDLDEEALALRPSARPMITAVLANVVLSALLLGVPYARGRERALESRRALSELSACVLGGTPRPDGGLALPAGDREAFASMFLASDHAWPARCERFVDALDHEPATFLLPSPKQAEADLHGLVYEMRESLASMQRARAEGSRVVPEAPLDSVVRLQTAVAALLDANDLELDALELAVELPASSVRMAQPSRIPLRTGAGFFAIETAAEHPLRAVAADGLGVADVRADPAGNVHLVQLRRPSGVHGVVPAAEGPWLAWTTSEATCDTDANHCAMRSIGLGALRESTHVLRAETWLAAHPALDVARSLAVSDARFTVLARRADGQAELRTFPRSPLTEPSSEGEGAAPARPDATAAVGDVLDAVTLDGRVVALVRLATGLAVRDASAASSTTWATSSDAEAVFVCGAHVVVAARSSIALRGTFGEHVWMLGVAAPIRGGEAESGSVAVACDDSRIAVAARTADAHVEVRSVSADGVELTETWPGVADDFDLAVYDGVAWVAASLRSERDVRVGSSPFSTVHAVGACWSSGTGMCGPAALAASSSGLVVVTRQGSDAFALRWDGTRFVGLPGLEGTADRGS